MNASLQNNYLAEIKSLVETASKTMNHEVLLELSAHPSMNVRRAVARNIYTPSSILNILANDVTVNVCVKALQNKNCYLKRDISKDALTHRCVVCEVQEIDTFTRCSQC